MEFETLKADDRRYPVKLKDRLGADAPTLYFQGPLRLLSRFTMAVISADMIPAHAMMATNDLLFKIREYSLNYIGPWHSVMETEIFRLALDTPTDIERRRSLSIFTARGLARENLTNFLGDRFGYSGPFTGFPQKEEFFRRANAGELLWLSAVQPGQKRFLRENILLRNWISCALADVVFVPFAGKKNKTFLTVKRILEAGIPIFTVDHPVCGDIISLGVKTFSRKTVGGYLESLGASVHSPPPFCPAEKPLSQTVHPLKPLKEIRSKQLKLDMD